MPTAPLALIEGGRLGSLIAPWWTALRPGAKPRGCRTRAGFRDLPRTGPTHLYLAPRPDVSVSSLLASLDRGFFLIEASGSCALEAESGRFSLRGGGFEVKRGVAAGPVRAVLLVGKVQQLLKGVLGVARDLSFVPRSSIVGSPTLLVEGLGLRAYSSISGISSPAVI